MRGPDTKVPRKWADFLRNDSNKKSLINFIYHEWQSDKYAKYLKDREIYFVNEESCDKFTSDGKITLTEPVCDLFSTQEEADTRIILHCLYACKQDNSRRICVRSQYTDVFLLLLAFSDAIQSTVYFDTGHGAKRRQINISGLADTFSKSARDAILGIHSFTGCDSTSCFSGKG